jgi:hypothetical protein
MTTEQILNCYEMRQRALEALFIGITFCRIWLQKLCCGFCTHLSKCFATTCNNTQHVDRISKNTLSPNTSASACLPPASRSNVFESVCRCFFPTTADSRSAWNLFAVVVPALIHENVDRIIKQNKMLINSCSPGVRDSELGGGFSEVQPSKTSRRRGRVTSRSGPASKF